jgi:hypothetical protein
VTVLNAVVMVGVSESWPSDGYQQTGTANSVHSLIRSGTSFCCRVFGAAQGCSVHREAVLCCKKERFNYNWPLRGPRHRRESVLKISVRNIFLGVN